MRLRHTYYLGTLRVEIIQKLSLKIIQQFIIKGHPNGRKLFKIKFKIIQNSLLGCAGGAPFLGVALRARNYSKIKIKNYSKIFVGLQIRQNYWWECPAGRNHTKSIQNQTESARFAWKLFKIKFIIIQIFRRDVGMVGGVEKLRGIMGISV